MNIYHTIPLLLLFLLLPASAVVITERPDTISNGHPIYITINDLPDDAAFSLLIEASFDVQPNSEFAVQMSHFNMPFTLNEGSVTATLDGTSDNRLEVMKGDTIVAVSGKSVDGHYTTTKNYDITAGTYDYFRLSGVSLPTTREIQALLQVSGVKQGADDSEINFFVEGMPEGTITLVALVDETQALFKTVTVSSETATPTPTQSEYNSAYSATATPTPTATQAWKDYYSADGYAQVRAFGIDYLGLVKVTPENVPAGWRIVCGPYSIMPVGQCFDPPATLSLKVPTDTSVANVAIFTYSHGNWTPVAAEFIDEELEVSLTVSGIYALLGPVHPSTPGITTDTPAISPETTHPVTKKPMPTSTTKLGMEMLTVLAGVAASLIVAAGRR